MINKITTRREMLRHLTTLGVLSALPAPVLARIITRQPAPSPFDDNATAEQVTEGLDLSGLTMAITGCNSGLGFETMRVLAMRGAHVIGSGRTLEKAQVACDSIDGQTTPVARSGPRDELAPMNPTRRDFLRQLGAAGVASRRVRTRIGL